MSKTTRQYETAEAPTTNDESERYRLLADDQRRTVIEVLDDRSEAVSLADLAATVAERDSRDGDGKPVEDVEIQLHHVHLPKLADAGVVDYDRESNRVDPRGAVIDLDH